MAAKAGKIADFQLHERDTGSADVQVVSLTEKIIHLTEHLQTHKKDHSSRRGLIILVSKRRKLLDYVKDKDVKRYKELIERLGLRR